MESDYKIQDKIDDYLLYRMSEQDRLSFEKEMAESDQLRQDVELQRMIKDEISERASFFKIMEDAEKQKTGRFIFFRSRTFYAIAASILILVTFFIWQPTQMSNEAIVEQYALAVPLDDEFQIDDDEGLRSITRSITNNADSLLNQNLMQAIKNYKLHKYENAAVNFKSVFEKENIRPLRKYFLISLIIEKQYDFAQKFILTQRNIDSNFYTEDVRYYDALLKIQIGDKKGAKRILEKLKESSVEYSQSSEEILKKMRWF